MNDEFKQLIEAIKSEKSAFDAAFSAGEKETMIRSIATAASAIGAMRVIREVSDEDIQNPDAIESGDYLINRYMIPKLLKS